MMKLKITINFLLLILFNQQLFSINFLKEIDKSEISTTEIISCENFISKNNLYKYKFVEINTKNFDSINFSFENLNNFKLIFIEELTSKNFKDLKKFNYQIEGSDKEVILYYFNKSKHSYFTFNFDDYIYNLNCIGKQHLITVKKIEEDFCGNDSIKSSDSNLKENIKNQLKFLSSYEECDIRLFIPYQDEVTDILNGKENVNELIKTSVDQLLDSYDNSNISNTTFRIARTSEFDYNSVDYLSGYNAIRQDLTNIKSISQINDIRNIYYSDLVHAIMASDYWSSIVGLADAILCDFSTAFCVTKYNYANTSGFFTFSHELGHLQGCRHHTDPNSTPFAYGHGYNYPLGSWRTIMASFTSTTRVLYWSNPNVTYGGVAMGTSSWEDNSRVIEETYDDMRDLIVTPTNYYMTDDDIVDEYDIADLVAFELLDVESEYITEPNSEVTFRAGVEIRIGPGFHSKSGSEFHAFIDDVDCSSSSKMVLDDSEIVFKNNSKLALSLNPSSGNTIATVEIGEKSICSLTLMDNLGNEVVTIFKDKELDPGKYQYDLEANNLSNGVYLCVLRIGSSMHSEKLVYLK